MQVFWRNFNMHGDDSITPLLKAYCDQPLFFHYLNYTSAVHSAILSNTVDRYSTIQKLVYYQSEVIQLLRGHVNLPASEKVPEWAITLVIALASMDYQQCLTQEVDEFLFVPYLANADWLNVFGKIRPHDSHLKAMHTLVERAGGFDSLQYPGLRGRVAWADLVQASMNGRRPVTPCVWEDTTSIEPLLTQSPRTMIVMENFSSVLGGLPPRILAILQRLVAFDNLLAEIRPSLESSTNDEIRTTKALRNIVQHSMLSLPTWTDLTVPERQGSYYAVYEIVRITCTIYCQTVIFPLVPHSGWHFRLLKKLQHVFELSNILDWNSGDEECPLLDLIIWSLTIAAIAARRCKFETFFTDMFRLATRERSLHSAAAIETVASQFLWQQSTCGRGLSDFWEFYARTLPLPLGISTLS